MSEWINFVRSYAKKHNLNYKDAMKEASKHYIGKGINVGGAKKSKSGSKSMSRKTLKKSSYKKMMKGGEMESISAKNYNKYYKAGVLLGGVLVGGAKSEKKKRLLTTLLEGLNASVN